MTFLKRLMLSVGLTALLILMVACHQTGTQAQLQLTSSPTFTQLPSSTPQPSQTQSATATPSATPTFTSTIQLPKQVLTPLPFTPEPISVMNAGRVRELTRWVVANSAFWQKADSTNVTKVKGFPKDWSFQLAFSVDGTSITLMPYNFSSTGTLGIYRYPSSTCIIGYDPKKGHLSVREGFPGITHLSIPEGRQINLISFDLLKSLDSDFGDYLYSPNGETLIIQAKDCQIQFLQSESGSSIKKINTLSGAHFGFSADGKIFWTGPYQNGYIAFLNPKNGELLQTAKVEWKHLAVMNKTEAEKTITFLGRSQNGGEIPDDGKVFNIVGISPNKKTFISSIHLDVWVHELDSAGNYVASELKGKQKIVLWDMSDSSMLHLLVENDDWKDEAIATYSPDSKQLAVYSSGDSNIVLFDSATGKRIRTLGKSEYLSLAYSMDGQYLIAGTNRSLELWDVLAGNLLGEIPLMTKLGYWAIAPDDRYIGTITEDGIISLWGVQP